MKITVFGASGKVGRIVIELLLAEQHEVTVFVHSGIIFAGRRDLTVITGDIHNATSVTKAVTGSDAVISTLGSWHTPTKDILSVAMEHIVPVMEQQRIRRIISLTGSGALAPADKPSFAERIAHAGFGVVAGKIISDAEKHLRLLADSSLDWTVVRASVMRRGNKPGYTLDQKSPNAWELITRTAVARAIVDQLEIKKWVKKAPHIHQA